MTDHSLSSAKALGFVGFGRFLCNTGLTCAMVLSVLCSNPGSPIHQSITPFFFVPGQAAFRLQPVGVIAPQACTTEHQLEQFAVLIGS